MVSSEAIKPISVGMVAVHKVHTTCQHIVSVSFQADSDS
jgi:hypothetical protein